MRVVGNDGNQSPLHYSFNLHRIHPSYEGRCGIICRLSNNGCPVCYVMWILQSDFFDSNSDVFSGVIGVDKVRHIPTQPRAEADYSMALYPTMNKQAHHCVPSAWELQT